MDRVSPVSVTADRTKRTLTIEWSDSATCDYPFAGLRAVCPCVECRGGHAHMGAPPDLRIVRETKNEALNLERIEPVGSYALQFFWSDGHSTGIYTWEYLRQACP